MTSWLSVLPFAASLAAGAVWGTEWVASEYLGSEEQ